MNLIPMTKATVADIMKDMRMMGGAPASDKTRQVYITRLCGLIKPGALWVLDQPELFKKIMRVCERPACSNLSYLKAVIQLIHTLDRTGRWGLYYAGDLETTAVAYRTLIREMNMREKEEAASRKQSRLGQSEAVEREVRLQT